MTSNKDEVIKFLEAGKELLDSINNNMPQEVRQLPVNNSELEQGHVLSDLAR